MLSNAYFLAKFRFDTAENEPAKNAAKNLQKFAKFRLRGSVSGPALAAPRRRRPDRGGLAAGRGDHGTGRINRPGGPAG